MYQPVLFGAKAALSLTFGRCTKHERLQQRLHDKYTAKQFATMCTGRCPLEAGQYLEAEKLYLKALAHSASN